MQAQPNNPSYVNKTLATIVALLSAGAIGISGYTLTAVKTPSVQINGGTALTKHLAQTVQFPATVFCGKDAGECVPTATVTSTITGARATDSVLISPPNALQIGKGILTSYSVATDTVVVTAASVAADATTTVATTTFNIDLWGSN